jgi:hypothetical protein
MSIFSKINDTALLGYVRLHALAADGIHDLATDRKARRATTLSAGIAAFGVLGGVAHAVGTATAGSGTCAAAATNVGTQIQSFVNPITDFLIIIAGAGFVIMVLAGGLFIMFGHTSGHKNRGVGYLKNAVIGLIIVIGAFAIRSILTLLVGGAATSAGNSNPCQSSINSGI